MAVEASTTTAGTCPTDSDTQLSAADFHGSAGDMAGAPDPCAVFDREQSQAGTIVLAPEWRTKRTGKTVGRRRAV